MKISMFLMGSILLLSIGIVHCMENAKSDEKAIIIEMDQLAAYPECQQRQSIEALLEDLKLNQNSSDYSLIRLCCNGMSPEMYAMLEKELASHQDLSEKWAIFVKYCVVREQDRMNTEVCKQSSKSKAIQNSLKRLFRKKVYEEKKSWILNSIVCGLAGLGVGTCIGFFI
jgi:hypothetical protein